VTRITVAVLDMAGTTIADDGVVEASFTAAMSVVGLGPETARFSSAHDYVLATMGRSKIEVFRHVLEDERLALQANSAFEEAYAVQVQAGAVSPIKGAEEAIGELRERGIRVALTTGFAPATRDLILRSVGWGDIADLVLAPSDVGRGRPYPDMNLTALLRLGGMSVRELLVAGDTSSDMAAAANAGASVRVGVRTGAGTDQELWDNGATHVLDDVTALPGLLPFT
jgi:phosphonatase-like hydrolase